MNPARKLRRVAPGLYVADNGRIHVAKRDRYMHRAEGWYVEFTNFFGAPQSRRFSTLAEAREFVEKL